MSASETELALLGETLRRLVRERYKDRVRDRGPDVDRSDAPEVRAMFAELGLYAALFDEAAGGLGGGVAEIVCVFGELGRGLVVEPFLQILMAGRILAAAGDEALLSQLIDGDRLVVVAHGEEAARYDAHCVRSRARQAGTQWSLSGSKSAIAFAGEADALIVSARIAETGELGLFLLPGADLDRTDAPCIDGSRAATIELAEVRVGSDALLLRGAAAEAALAEAVDAGLLAIAAEAVGLMDALRDQTIAYLRDRRQFGAPIGSFQALQHRIATIAVEIEQARSAVANAEQAFGAPGITRARALSAAKATTGRVGRLVAEEAIQMHGGIGMTWELPAAHYAKRLVMLDHYLADEDHHLRRFAELGRTAPAEVA